MYTNQNVYSFRLQLLSMKNIQSKLSTTLPRHTESSNESFVYIQGLINSSLDNLTEESIYELSQTISDEVTKDIPQISPEDQLNQKNVRYYDVLGLAVPFHSSQRQNDEIVNLSDLKDYVSDWAETLPETDVDRITNFLTHTDDNTDLLGPILESIRKISQIMEEYTGNKLALTSSAKSCASAIATFNSIYGILYSIYNFATICLRINETVSNPTELEEQQSNSFLLSFSLVIAEATLFWTPISFTFAWKGTRKVSNLGLYKLRSRSRYLQQFVLSRIHYFFRDAPSAILQTTGQQLEENKKTNIQDFIQVLGTTASQTMLLHQIHRLLQEGNVRTNSQDLFKTIKKVIKEEFEFYRQKTQFSNELIDDIESLLEDISETEVLSFVSGTGSNLLDAVEPLSVKNEFLGDILDNIVSQTLNSINFIRSEAKNALLNLLEMIMSIMKSSQNDPEQGIIQYP